ncbi:DUF882 domain-containing protein [Elioraea sp.]|uniref:DUF882 domain-containing protein n=1 Tax=Elioraea sp. TaxID=2185103 RepID=UPI0025B8F56B|nr:DUF882 domain-containing protein [Elioraea sp.]
MTDTTDTFDAGPCPCCTGPFRVRRRALLAASLVAAFPAKAALPEGPARTLAGLGPERRLSLVHAADEERWEGTYWRNGAYDAQALDALSHLLRDRTADKAGTIAPSVFDILYLLDRRIVGRGFVVVSAYRTPETQAALAARWGRAATSSFHVTGQAVDVRRPGLHATGLLGAAVQLRAGGVGLYRGASPYVHLDTGPVRRW